MWVKGPRLDWQHLSYIHFSSVVWASRILLSLLSSTGQLDMRIINDVEPHVLRAGLIFSYLPEEHAPGELLFNIVFTPLRKGSFFLWCRVCHSGATLSRP
jgi:hypothetical protein